MTATHRRRRALTGDEVDVHGPWRHYLSGLRRAGATAKVKRVTTRRERREGKAETRDLD
jgi:hypothetical protein